MLSRFLMWKDIGEAGITVTVSAVVVQSLDPMLWVPYASFAADDSMHVMLILFCGGCMITHRYHYCKCYLTM
jgi:hypothetical protein